MKTIAISIDETTLEDLDRIARATQRGRRVARRVNRSQVVRLALQEFVRRQDKREREERDRRVFETKRTRIEREARALVAEQAEL